MGYRSYRERKAIRKKWHKRSFLLLSFCLCLLLLNNFGYSTFRISSGSMKPNLAKGDVILVSRFFGRNINRLSGQIVILDAGPGRSYLSVMVGRIISVITFNKIQFNSLIHPHNQGSVIRRSVAIAGDSFMVRDKIVFFRKSNDIISELMIYGNTYQIEKYSQPELLENIKIPYFTENEWITVPENKVLCLSDYRNRYIDSFEIGLVDIKDIKWVAKLKYWPLNEFKFL